MKHSRIHILGGPGSGKSYCGKRLSARLKQPLVNLDRMHYGSADVKQRDKALAAVLAKHHWIVEGHWLDWASDGFSKADVIIFLDVPLWRRELRILGRVVRRTLGVEKGRRYSLKDISEMLALARSWDRTKALSIVKRHKKKTRTFRKADEAEI